jgi:hypothetical protein
MSISIGLTNSDLMARAAVRALRIGPGGEVNQKWARRALAVEPWSAVLGGVLVSRGSAREEVRRVAFPKTWTASTHCLNRWKHAA